MAGYKYLVMERRSASSLIVLLACGALSCSTAYAAQLLAPGTLPVASANWLGSGSATLSQGLNQLTINQASQRAILNWQSFNIANGSSVSFVQPDASAVALNRIYDQNPSVIQGALNANGQVYLINNNGILFDKGAQINVHTLVASTLDISDDIFNKGIGAITDGNPVFAGGSVPDGMVRVEAGAQLNAASGGKIMLFAPKVENNGVITTPDGQTILAAGSKVYLAPSPDTDPGLRGLLVEVDNGGSASNQNLGKIIAARGNVTLAGLAVNQQGRITATTSVNSNGSIRLLARDTVQAVATSNDGSGNKTVTATRTGTVTLQGSNSVTEVTPDLGDATTSPDEQAFYASRVEVMGGKIQMLEGSRIVAAGGEVSLTALENPSNPKISVAGSAVNASRVYLDGSSAIDVSGTQNVEVPIERNLVKVDLYGSVLKDSPLQNSGPLRGKTISVDITKGTPLGDYSGYEAGIGRTVAERTAAGGKVKMTSEGDIVVRQGATVNLSGGSLHYLDGYLNTTKLVSQGKIVDISEATPDRVYEGIVGTITRDHAKWGVTESWVSTLAARGQFTQGYVEGKNAGTLQFIAPSMTMEGTVIGKTTAGIYQRQPYSIDLDYAPYKTLHKMLPNGATLIVGDDAQATQANPDFKTSSVSFVAQATPLPDGFVADTALSAERTGQVQLAAGLIGKDAVANLAVYSNGKIDLASGLTLNAPGGSVSLVGREVAVAGNIDVQSGSITLQSRDVFGQPAGSANTVSVSGTLSASGGWVNDYAAIRTGGVANDPVLTKGGSIVIRSLTDVLLQPSSTLDVSGGGWVDAKGVLAGKGDAGSIDIASGAGLPATERNATTLTLGNLYGYALGKGGSLSLSTGKVQIGAAGQPGDLALSTSFFSQGGFSKIKVNGTDGLNIAAGSAIQGMAESLVINPQYRATATGRSMAAISHRELLPDPLRKPGSLTFSASSQLYGNLDMQKGARIAVDAGGSINLSAGRQMTVDGTLTASAGTIGLTLLGTPGSGGDDAYGFLPNQSIWLGKDAQLLSRGFDNTLVKDNGLRQGEILDGGQVSINAQKGYVVTETGSLIDVSGTSGAVDVLRGAGGRSTYQGMEVASNAGSINIAASEGTLLDGGMLGRAGGTGALGGAFSLKVDRGDNYDPAFVFSSGVTSYPGADRQVVVSQQGGFVPAGLKAGDVIDTATLNGKGKVAADSLMNGGFAQIALQAKDAVSFDGDVTLQTARSIQLDAPTIVADYGKTVNLSSGYVGIANSNPKYQALPKVQGGSARLNVAAQWIDLTGKVALNGFGQTVLASSGDIRLKGVWNQDNSNRALLGSFSTAGDLEMRARQIYPTTLSEFEIAIAGNPAGTLHIAANGSDTPVLAAGGKLTLSAPNIVQDGVLKAPLGEVVLSADNSLTLGSASITSVSAEGQVIPFGMTSNGKDWQYALDGSTNLSITTPPEKRVTLDGNDINIKNGARVDLSGGGDLYAYEFIPGPPGRSVDILDVGFSSNSYAVMPGLKGAYAPYDTQYSAGSSLKPGDSVYLSAANGLPAGIYTLLPARYALLPGAFLVQSVSGYRDMQPQQKVNLADGTQIVAGYRTVTDKLNDVARFSGFALRSGADIKKEAEYQQSTASQFFAQQAQLNGTAVPRLPVDAGQLVLAPHNTLALQGDPLKTNHDGGRGAIVDVDVNNLFIGDGTNTGPAGYVSIDATTLTRLNAESVLLGGTRKTATDGVEINVDSDHVVVANSVEHALKAPEIILVARDKITVNAGSDIEGAGSAGSSQDLIVGRGSNGDGALLRVAAGDNVEVKRENVQRAAGTLDVGSNVLLAGTSITLDATLDTASKADLQLDGGSLSLGAGRISMGDTPVGTSGLALSGAKLAELGSLTGLYLKSYSTIDFYGNLELGTGQSRIQHLALDAGSLRGFGNAGNSATLAAGDIALHNSSTPNAEVAAAAGSALNLQSLHGITLAEGNQHVSGFGSMNLATGGDVNGHGTGALLVDGDLNLQAARITADSKSDQKWTATGKVQISQPATAGASAQAAPIGGKLAISGQRVVSQGNIELAAGLLSLSATGSGADDNVTLAAGSKTSAAGVAKNFAGLNVFAPGGQIKLASSNGNVDVQNGATVDVSGAADGGDAGTLQTSAVNGQVLLSGELKGGAASGARLGSYTQDTKTLANFSALNTVLEAGKFNEQRDIRIRQGEVEVAAGDSVHARQFSLAADAGKVDISGQVDASGDKGGQLRIAARDNVTLHNGGSLKAKGTTGKGGTVELSTSSGTLKVENDAHIGVSGASGNAASDGGQVVLRAPRTEGNNVAITLGSGVVSGAREVIAEAFKVYDGIGSVGTTTGSGKLNINTVKTETSYFMANAAAVEAQLGNHAQLRAGIEVRASGDLALVNDWDLSGWHTDGRPVMLTMRAAGDLNINSNLSDGFSSAATTATLGSGASAFYRLVSGADMSAANLLANQSKLALDSSGKGNLNVAAGKLVRTGTGSIAMAAGRNLVLGSDSSVVYTAGENVDAVSNFAVPASSSYARNGGNLTMAAQGDINGAVNKQLITEWLHRQGQLNSNGSFKKNTSWWLRYDQFKQGVGALGGGDVDIAAGGDISNFDAAAPTTGRVSGSSASDASVDIQGGGDLSVRAGGDILSGTYYVARGVGTIAAEGGIISGRTASDGTPIHTVLALADGRFDVTALHDLQLETIVNPTMVAQGKSQGIQPPIKPKSFFLTYAPDSKASLLSVAGNASLSNNVAALQKTLPDLKFGFSTGQEVNALAIYPGNLSLSAMQGNIEVNKRFALSPSSTGNLNLLAAGGVAINGNINLSDADPALLPNVFNPTDTYKGLDEKLFTSLYSSKYGAHADSPVHAGDRVPARIVALNGNLVSANEAALFLAKPVQIEAGHDIVDLNLHGQNLAAGEVTSIHAGRDITYIDPYNANGKLLGNSRTIQLDGPGRLELSAGRNLNLGNSVGVVTQGNLNNPALPDQGADIAVMAGVSGSPDYSGFAAKYGLNGVSGYSPELAQAFFKQLMQAGDEHNEGKDGSVDKSTGQMMGYQRGYDAIAALFPGSGYQGNLNLFFSQIKTFRGGNIDLFVPGGKINAGLASVPADLISAKISDPQTETLASKLGVVTMKGGSIRSMSKGDFLVNSSRVFTLQGGDIALWSSEGDIDAGKGAKTALAVPPPIIRTKADGTTEVEYQGAATGSGIRVLLTASGVKPGDVYLIAPKGKINAGDAGIGSEGKIHIAAPVVIGGDNISSKGGTTGVPMVDTGSLAAGLIGVSGQAADAGKAGADAAQMMAQQKPQDSFRQAFLNVEVIGFGD
ncbi:MAG: filamentous hemagglutinin family protein [Gammaproteobacteria bacterium]|nr:filamentous hemagglutinin family protein [Gammaproteobacteria bacterium]